MISSLRGTVLSESVAALAREAVRAVPPVASRAEAPAAICMNERRDAAVDLGGAIIFLASISRSLISSFPSCALDCPALLLAAATPGCRRNGPERHARAANGTLLGASSLAFTEVTRGTDGQSVV